MAKNFRELEREALADPRRRANIERERALLNRATEKAVRDGSGSQRLTRPDRKA